MADTETAYTQDARKIARKHAALGERLRGKSIAILVLNFSPYHVARLRFIAEVAHEWGARLLGIELASVDTQYPWTVDRQKEAFEWHTLFQDRPMHQISHAEQVVAIGELLSQMRPAAVIIPGWSHGFHRGALRWCRRNSVVHVVQTDSVRDLIVPIEGELRRRWYKELAKRMHLRGVDAAQGAGDLSVDYLVKLGVPRERCVRKLDVVDNGYFARVSREVRAQPAPHRTALKLPDRFFLYPSRFIDVKNHVRLIEAYRLYLEQAGNQAWDLLLLGSGPTEPQVVPHVQRLPGNRVEIRPYVPITDLARYYALASGLIFPSYSDTWGLIVNEAAAAGLPMLLSKNVMGQEHLLQEGRNGWVFHPLDTAAMAACMLRLSRLPEAEREAMGRCSQEIIASWDLKDHSDELFTAVTMGFARRKNASAA